MKAHRLSVAATRRTSRGFSLIELMVGITIALIVTLVIFQVLIASETRKRSSTVVNDINQSGAYSAYVLDRAIRSAGSGFANQRVTLLRGADLESCRLNIQRGVTTLVPRTANFPAPFADPNLRAPVLAPVIIDQGTNSDVITVMSGSQGRSEVGNRVIGPSPAGVAVVNTFAFNGNDLVLFGHPASEGNCVVSQVANTFAAPVLPTTDPANQSLPLAGTYVSGVSAAALVNNLTLGIGNDTTNRPQFKMFGVDQTANTLVALDLFSFDHPDPDATARSEPVAEGVIEMRALYGVDTNDDNVLDSWQVPTGATWGPVALRNGSVTSSANLRRIVAIRLALVLRSSLAERDPVAARNSFSVFGDVSTVRTVPTVVPANANLFRYRVIETTIPLRNNLLKPPPL